MSLVQNGAIHAIMIEVRICCRKIPRQKKGRRASNSLLGFQLAFDLRLRLFSGFSFATSNLAQESVSVKRERLADVSSVQQSSDPAFGQAHFFKAPNRSIRPPTSTGQPGSNPVQNQAVDIAWPIFQIRLDFPNKRKCNGFLNQISPAKPKVKPAIFH
jgi:hypothetical protein